MYNQEKLIKLCISLLMLGLLFFTSISYANPIPIVKQVQYDNLSYNFKAIHILYGGKEATIPYSTGNMDSLKAYKFIEQNHNFIFVQINRHYGTGLSTIDALILDADDLSVIPIIDDGDFIQHNFYSKIDYINRKIVLHTDNQSIILRSNSKMKDVFDYAENHPSLFKDYDAFTFSTKFQYAYRYTPQGMINIIKEHLLIFPYDWAIGNITVFYRYDEQNNAFVPDKNNTVKINISDVYQ